MIARPALKVEAYGTAPPGWDGFVESDREGTFCHLSAWGEVFRTSLRLEPLYAVASSGGEVAGVLPLIRMPRLPLGRALVSMPYLNYGGPLGSPSASSALLEWTIGEAGKAGIRSVEIRSRSTPATPLSAGREKVAVLLELPEDSKELFDKRLPSKVRSQIRRPLKEGMEARFGPDHLPAFYEVFASNMRDLGTPVLPRGLFERISQAFPERFRCGAVYHGEKPVAAGCGFRWRDEFEMTWASSLRSLSRLAPNMLLYWSFLERCVDEGVRLFNFGRCTPGSGSHRFKRQWGGKDRSLSWGQWPEAAGPPDASSSFFRAATSVWRHLPLGITNHLGPVVARRLPTF